MLLMFESQILSSTTSIDVQYRDPGINYLISGRIYGSSLILESNYDLKITHISIHAVN